MVYTVLPIVSMEGPKIRVEGRDVDGLKPSTHSYSPRAGVRGETWTVHHSSRVCQKGISGGSSDNPFSLSFTNPKLYSFLFVSLVLVGKRGEEWFTPEGANEGTGPASIRELCTSPGPL